MENRYPGNSDRERENLPATQQNYQQKRVTESVVKGGATVKEQSVLRGVANFFGIEECHSFRDYVAALSDMTNRVYGAIDTLLGNRKYQNSTVPGARVSYTSYYNNPVQATPPAQAQPVPRQNLDQYGPFYIQYDFREDAEIVLAKMMELLQIYHNVSIDDMYDLAGITSPVGYTGANYGWKEGMLNGARVRPYGSKFVIELPAIVPIP